MTQRTEVYRRLPPVYVLHFKHVLRPSLDSGGPGKRPNARELETLSEAMGCLLDGEPLRAFMVLLGRRKAVVHASVGGGSWSSAPYWEVLPPAGSALSARDRGNAAKDLRDALKLSQAESGRALPGRNTGRGQSAPRRASEERRGSADRGARS